MNTYVTVPYLKDSPVMNVARSINDLELLRKAEAVCRLLDGYTNRHFYDLTDTKKLDGNGSEQLYLDDDLIAITTLKTDDNLDRTFNVTWATTDYLLLPSNSDPDTDGNPRSMPFTKIEADLRSGTKDFFTAGRESVEITGRWGYWSHVRRATAQLSAAVSTTTATAIAFDTGEDIEMGHTILIGTEQMYVESIDGANLNVRRGVNGTTAETHLDDAKIDYYEYPALVVDALIEQMMKLWRRPETKALPPGVAQVPPESLDAKVLHADIRRTLAPLVRHPV